MCGIAGIFNLASGAPADLGLVRRMTESIRHRGPDDDGSFSDGALALGFRRLSIIDLTRGHQPITSDCGRYTIILNGEIYNYQELRRPLEADHGVRFRTTSDTEVLLYALRQWGEGALSRLNGMFAFALWDAQERSLLLARDRLGKKPLYYAATPDGFCFASEIKALLAHPGVSTGVDVSRIPTFVTYRYVPGDETLFSGISCLPPASSLVLSQRAPRTPKRYWDYSFAGADGTGPAPDGRRAEGRLQDRFRELLTDSVRLRMIADVPFGAFLSGGIDSSVVVALMSRLHPEPLKTFSIGFEAGVDETAYARQVAERYRTDHHEVRVGASEIIRNIPAVLHARESPITEASDIPIYLLSELARKKVTVVLSGEGSDEILAGYPKYAFERAWPGGLLPRRLVAAVARHLPFGLRRLQLALQCAAEGDPLERHAAWFGAFGPEQRERLLSPDLRAQGGLHGLSASLLAGKRFPSAVEEMLYLDTAHWLPANLLLRGDRMTMAHSLELRCPFLDYRLVEFAAREVPLSLKIRGMNGKWLLKRLATDLVPPAILERRKWGFKVPMGEWFRGPLSGMLRDVLLSPRALGRGYFVEETLRGLVDAHLAGRTDYEKQLWILFQLELWHLMFVDRTLSPSDRLDDVAHAGASPAAALAGPASGTWARASAATTRA